MRDIYDHNPADHDDPAAAPTWTIGIVSVVLLAATTLFVAALFYFVYQGELEEKYIQPTSIELDMLNAEQRARLAGEPRIELRPENADAEQPESIVIPIDQAMDLIVEEGLSGRP